MVWVWGAQKEDMYSTMGQTIILLQMFLMDSEQGIFVKLQQLMVTPRCFVWETGLRNSDSYNSPYI